MTETSAIEQLLLAMADDELVLGHRNSEWTGHSPILEEDIAFSNIAQDEIGHSLVWYSLYEQLTQRSPDTMAFERSWNEFTSCRFVTYPKGDFAYTVVRQFLFDIAEEIRLKALSSSSYSPVKDAAAKILKEEAYHRLHLQGLVERLGDGTEESHRRMQTALDAAFPQALGMFEKLPEEDALVNKKVMIPNEELKKEWLAIIIPVLKSSTLALHLNAQPDLGGRNRKHTEHLQQLMTDLQSVYRSVPETAW